MIINGGARGNIGFWSDHLRDQEKNDRAEVIEVRGTLADDLPGALSEMKLIASGSRCQGDFMYVADISPNPGERLTDKQWREAIDLLEEKLGFVGHPRVVVEHEKDGRVHRHIVWTRIDGDLKVKNYSWNYLTHERVARALETRFDLTPTPSRHGMQHDGVYPDRAPTLQDYRVAEKAGTTPQERKAALTEARNKATSPEHFRQTANELGYVLALGDQRDYVLVDRNGTPLSVPKAIQGGDTHEIGQWLDGIADTLPSFPEAKQAQLERYGTTPGERKLTPKRAAAHALKSAMTGAWNQSDSGRSLQAAIAEAGYVLAVGDNRAFVVVGRDGVAYSLPRYIEGVNTTLVRERLKELRDTLPQAEAAQEIQRQAREAVQVEPKPEPVKIESLPELVRMYRGIGENVWSSQPGEALFFSTDPVRAAAFGQVHYVDVTPDELTKFEQPHSKRILAAEPIAANDWRTADQDVIGRLKILEADQVKQLVGSEVKEQRAVEVERAKETREEPTRPEISPESKPRQMSAAEAMAKLQAHKERLAAAKSDLSPATVEPTPKVKPSAELQMPPKVESRPPQVVAETASPPKSWKEQKAEERTALLTAALDKAQTGRGFCEAANAVGYVVARGDQGNLIVVDGRGYPASLRKSIEGPDVRDRLDRLSLWRMDLPSLDEAKAMQKAAIATGEPLRQMSPPSASQAKTAAPQETERPVVQPARQTGPVQSEKPKAAEPVEAPAKPAEPLQAKSVQEKPELAKPGESKQEKVTAPHVSPEVLKTSVEPPKAKEIQPFKGAQVQIVHALNEVKSGKDLVATLAENDLKLAMPTSQEVESSTEQARWARENGHKSTKPYGKDEIVVVNQAGKVTRLTPDMVQGGQAALDNTLAGVDLGKLSGVTETKAAQVEQGQKDSSRSRDAAIAATPSGRVAPVSSPVTPVKAVFKVLDGATGALTSILDFLSGMSEPPPPRDQVENRERILAAEKAFMNVAEAAERGDNLKSEDIQALAPQDREALRMFGDTGVQKLIEEARYWEREQGRTLGR